MARCGLIGRALIGFALVGAATPAFAESGLIGGDQLRGFLDMRVGASAGERSWVDGGYGKTRFGGAGDDIATHGQASGMLIWRPHLTWSLDGYFTLRADTQAAPAVDVVEAFLSYRGAPTGGWRWSGRAGVFYPPVSLEHDGQGWTTTNTLTPSAINSWISEEVKVGGVEVTARRTFGYQDFSATAALFGFNDTAGTLLAMRGWALGDVMPGVRGRLPLPSYSYQHDDRPSMELDGRVGHYARLQYRPIGPLSLDLMHYDNAGDRVSDRDGQTNWRTRFTNVGLRAAFGADTRLLAQAMTGRTVWGRLTPAGYWSDVDFAAAYVLVAHDFGARTLTGRLDYFDISDNSNANPDDEGEEGWAATAAYLVQLSPNARLAFEGVHVSSQRPQREEVALNRRQQQTTVQSSLKLSF